MHRRSVLSALSLFIGFAPVAGCEIAGEDFIEVGTDELAGRNREELRFFSRHSRPLQSTRIGTPGADLEFLSGTIGRARLVGLGEGTHGTADFNAVRARIVRHLVEREGFRVFVLEDDATNTASVRRYIEGETDDFDEAFGGSFIMWQDTETRRLWDWLRAYNLAHPQDPVRFYGNDAQLGVWPDATGRQQVFAVERLRALTGAAPELEAALTAYEAASVAYAAALPNAATELEAAYARQAEVVSAAAALRAAFTQARGAFAARLGDERTRLVEHAILALEQVPYSSDPASYARFVGGADLEELRGRVQLLGRDLATELSGRNRVMAQLAVAALEAHEAGTGRRARGVLWAHNGHVARHDAELSPLFGRVVPDMGGFLTERLGAGYFALLTEARRGRFAATVEQADGSGLPGAVELPALGATSFARFVAPYGLPRVVRFRKGDERINLPASLERPFELVQGPGWVPADPAEREKQLKVEMNVAEAADAVIVLDRVEAADWYLGLLPEAP